MPTTRYSKYVYLDQKLDRLMYGSASVWSPCMHPFVVAVRDQRARFLMVRYVAHMLKDFFAVWVRRGRGTPACSGVLYTSRKQKIPQTRLAALFL